MCLAGAAKLIACVPGHRALAAGGVPDNDASKTGWNQSETNLTLRLLNLA